MSHPVVLCILDGWGLRAETEANAIALAETPSFDRLIAERPSATLKTSGEDVGLPPGQMGNSEVGHMNLGAGRVVWMDLPKIDKAIADGSLAERPALATFLAAVRGAVHVLGLMSPGGVHAHQRHIAELARIAAATGRPVKLHLFLDGRDTPPQSALEYLEAFEAAIDDLTDVSVATISGRFYAMDRDTRWERVEEAYRAIADAEGLKAASAQAAVEDAYARGETDEFVKPTVIGAYSGPSVGDGVLMANFRADRAREILSALLDPDFDGFARARPPFTAALGMVEYSDAHSAYMGAIFPQEQPEDTLGEWLAGQGKKQLRIAETEKYPHVTFFFNGGVEPPNVGEERYLAPSPKVKTYDMKPEMSAAEVCGALVEAVRGGAYDLIVVNFANPDMVGHTGDLAAAIKAVEAVDQALGQVMEAVEAVGGAMVVTADHGNCEMMVDPETGGPHTAHTTNPVPVALLDARPGAEPLVLRDGGRLADVAPTLLALIGAPAPNAMTGESLLERP